jgi:localization factor PodJL
VAIGGLQLSSAFLGSGTDAPELPVATPDNAPAAADQTGNPAIAPAPASGPAAGADAALSAPALPAGPEGAAVNLPAGVDLLASEPADVAALPAQPETPRVVGTEAVSSAAPDAAAAAPDASLSADAAVAAPVATLPADFGPAPLVAAAKTGDVKALFEIGRRFSENGADAEGLKTALAWFDAAAQAGFAPAQYRLGNMYEKGLGTPLDAEKAKLWYQMAAEQGNASAMHNLAVLHANGANGTADAESAARWFIKAAELGVADSQYNLGILAAKGQGMTQDLEESYKWFAIVAKAGDKDAEAKRDEIAKALRPEQLESARAKTELWKPKDLIVATNDISVPDEWRIAQATTASVDVKKAITNVQLILTKLGYDAGPADGVMGGKTRNAIRAFQETEKLPVTGEIDAALVKALLAKNG